MIIGPIAVIIAVLGFGGAVVVESHNEDMQTTQLSNPNYDPSDLEPTASGSTGYDFSADYDGLDNS